MVTPPNPPPYSIAPRPPGIWIDIKTGQPTTEFYRFIVNLFQSSGSGQAPVNLAALIAQVTALATQVINIANNLTALNDYTFTLPIPDIGPLEQALSEVEELFWTQKNADAAISTLQRKLSDIEVLFFSKRSLDATVSNQQRRISDLEALVLSERRASPFVPSSGLLSNVASNVPLSSSVAANIVTLPIPPGDWDVSGNFGIVPAGANLTTILIGAITTTSATLPSPPNSGAYVENQIAYPAGTVQILPIGTIQINTRVATTAYLVCRADWTTSTMTGFGFIRARRMG